MKNRKKQQIPTSLPPSAVSKRSFPPRRERCRIRAAGRLFLASLFGSLLILAPREVVPGAAGSQTVFDLERLEARRDGRELMLRIPTSGLFAAGTSVKFDLRIVSPDGTLLGRRSGKWTSRSAGSIFKTRISISGGSRELAFGRLFYRFDIEGSAFSGVADLSSVIPALDCKLFCQDQLAAGTGAALRVILTDEKNLPVEKGEFTVALFQGKKLAASLTGITGQGGTAETVLAVPPDIRGECRLRVDAAAGGLTASLETRVTIIEKLRILVTTDKPLYQPGQAIRFRALALSSLDRNPASGAVHEWLIEDPRGNKVFRKTIQADRFGVSSADFLLAGEALTGRYTIECGIGGESGTRTVTVERYKLPRFSVETVTDGEVFLPGGKLEGVVTSRYFFGKPVDGGRVSITVETFEAGRVEVASAAGVLDGSGQYSFSLQLPDYFAGIPLEQGRAILHIKTEVRDGSGHLEFSTVQKTVASEPVLLAVVPEGGTLVGGLPNRIFVLALNPDGTPISGADLKLRVAGGARVEAVTGVSGVASFYAGIPEGGGAVDFDIQVEAPGDVRVRRRIVLEAEKAMEAVIVKTDACLVTAGETLEITALGVPDGRTVYFDGVAAGQTVWTGSAMVKGGEAALSMNLPSDISGTLVVHGYIVSSGSNLVRGRALVCVLPAEELQISLDAGDDGPFAPGSDGIVKVDVTDPEGNGVEASAVVAVVDEAVFARKEMYPGFERLFFLLEREVLEPRYEIHGASMDKILLPAAVKDPAREKAAEETAAVVAAAASADVYYGVARSTLEEERVWAEQIYRDTVRGLAEEIYPGLARLLSDKKRDLPGKGGDLVPVLIEHYISDTSVFLDPWDRRVRVLSIRGSVSPYRYPGGFILVSAGPDGVFDSNDDIVVNFEEVIRAKMGVRGLDANVMFMAQAELPAMADGMLEKKSVERSGGGAGGAEPPRVRAYFPETLLFAPVVATDVGGSASIPLKWADSITSWRLTAFASDERGRCGSAVASAAVFQPFFADLDPPLLLTAGDEVALPAMVFNYTEEKIRVDLSLEEAKWFESTDSRESVSLEAGEVGGASFTVRFTKPGTHRLKLEARGAGVADAVEREVTVVPDGRRFENSVSGQVEDGGEARLFIPAAALPGGRDIIVKLYPGILSQVVEGLDSILRMPFGCFEQTSSITYPNVLVLDYFRKAALRCPETALKAEEYISLGYQRLLAFEVDGGGFSWFGDAPANGILTAWGLMEFADMEKVHPVDGAVLDRTASWLVSRQRSDGSFPPDEHYIHAESWKKLQESDLLVTAYHLWGLAAAGREKDAASNALSYLSTRAGKADQIDVIAIVLNALLTADAPPSVTAPLLEKLAAAAIIDGETAFWRAETGGLTQSGGRSADIELTALVAMAFIETGYRPDLSSKALNFLVREKDPNGTWYSTHATILSLKALLSSLGGRAEKTDVTVEVFVNDRPAGRETFTAENFDVMRILRVSLPETPGIKPTPASRNPGTDRSVIKPPPGSAYDISFKVRGDGAPAFQAVARFYVPWEEPVPGRLEPLAVSVEYDRVHIQEDDQVDVAVRVENRTGRELKMVVVDIGFPPGFDPVPGSLENLVETEAIDKFERTTRGAIIYFDTLQAAGEGRTFDFSLVARYPLRAKTGAARAWAYYDPDSRGVAVPRIIQVTE